LEDLAQRREIQFDAVARRTICTNGAKVLTV